MNDLNDPNDVDLALWREYCEDPAFAYNAAPGRDPVDLSPTAPWRSLPPTSKQLKILEHFNDFTTPKLPELAPERIMLLTRGGAADLIDKLKLAPASEAASERARDRTFGGQRPRLPWPPWRRSSRRR